MQGILGGVPSSVIGVNVLTVPLLKLKALTALLLTMLTVLTTWSPPSSSSLSISIGKPSASGIGSPGA